MSFRYSIFLRNIELLILGPSFDKSFHDKSGIWLLTFGTIAFPLPKVYPKSEMTCKKLSVDTLSCAFRSKQWANQSDATWYLNRSVYLTCKLVVEFDAALHVSLSSPNTKRLAFKYCFSRACYVSVISHNSCFEKVLILNPQTYVISSLKLLSNIWMYMYTQ